MLWKQVSESLGGSPFEHYSAYYDCLLKKPQFVKTKAAASKNFRICIAKSASGAFVLSLPCRLSTSLHHRLYSPASCRSSCFINVAAASRSQHGAGVPERLQYIAWNRESLKRATHELAELLRLRLVANIEGTPDSVLSQSRETTTDAHPCTKPLPHPLSYD